MFLIKIAGHGNHFPAEPHQPAVAKFFLVAFAEKHAERGEDEKRPKEAENEVKTRDERNAQPNHYPAHDEGAENSPNQHAVLRFSGDAEIAEDQNKNKNVIDAERILDDVTGQKIETRLGPFQAHHENVESKRECDPKKAATPGRAHAQFAVAPLKLRKIDNDRDEHTDVKRDPKPNASRHRIATVSRQRAHRNRKGRRVRLFSRELERSS